MCILLLLNLSTSCGLLFSYSYPQCTKIPLDRPLNQSQRQCQYGLPNRQARYFGNGFKD